MKHSAEPWILASDEPYARFVILTAVMGHSEDDADVKEAAQQMLYLEVHRLFVEENGQLVGVISQSDIVRGVATAKI